MVISGLYIGASVNKGRGVFTHLPIHAETIVEVSPVIVMTAREREVLDTTALHDYIFVWGAGQDQCCMAMGYVPLYNHSYASNCEYFMDYEERTMMIKAVRDIEPEEELTINYNGDWNDNTPLWFDAI